MIILHAHWRPPRRPSDTGGVLFWAETSDAPPPVYLRGRLPKKHSAKEHPFNLSAEELREKIGAGTPLGDARIEAAKLRIPATRTGPIPSLDLAHNWQLDTETRPFMAPWIIEGLWLPAGKSYGILVNLPTRSQDNSFVLGHDTQYWRTVANLVLEILASQKLVPVLVPVNHNEQYQARWMPVLDGPQDGARLAQLAAAMPPVCRIELLHPNGRYRSESSRSSQVLLDLFLKNMCDSLIRSWSKSVAPVFESQDDDPFRAWISALFQEDATVRASQAQLQALSSSLRAWMRNLQAAGDSISRIAFRLESPEQQSESIDSEDWKIHFMLQARDDPSLLIAAEDIWRCSGNALQTLGRRFENPQEKLLAGLGYAARLYPSLLEGLQSTHPTSMNLNTKSAYKFLREYAPLLEQAGFGLLSPPWWNQPQARLGVRLRLMPKQDLESYSVSGGKLGLDNLISYKWELALGDTSLTQDEFKALAALKSPLVQIRGKWVQLDSEQIEAAIRFWESKNQIGEMNLLNAAQFSLGGSDGSSELPLTDVVAEDWLADWIERLSDHDRVSILPQPDEMQGELRAYQRVGFSWLAFFRRWNLGACLADDMGLGKTIQTLALLQYEKEHGGLTGPILLICPTSVVMNWQKEAQRFTPKIMTMVHQGPGRLRGTDFIERANDFDMVLSSYAVVRQDAELLQQVSWMGVIIDEAQNIKNSSAKQSQAVRQLSADFRIALTGTPVENRLIELWSIMHFLNPGYLSSRKSFQRDFAIPIERFSDLHATQRLRSLVSPFILRRVKSDPDVIQDLPEKIEVKEFCNLVEEQATLYEAVVQDVLNQVNQADGLERKGLVLKLLMQLKQICNHPVQYLHQVDAAMTDIKQINGRSGKLSRITDMMEEILATGNRILVFTQFVEMGKILSSFLPQALGCSVQFLHGGTPVKQREQMVKRFQEDPNAPSIFILSLKAGGTGLNLTRANHIFHFDRWWNPAVEDQATDRAYRIGQHANVQVHKFITIGTLEEKIDEMIESKKGLAQAIIGSGEQWLTELSTDELRELVQLRK